MSNNLDGLKPGPKTSWNKRVVDFWNKVDKSGECWLFTGSTIRGYGQFNVLGKNWSTHRLAYTLSNGHIPDGMELDHLCRVRNCVNPEHLDPVTPLENKRRSPNSNISKTHCKRGHELIPENTVKVPKGRRCLVCKREHGKLWMAVQTAKDSVSRMKRESALESWKASELNK